MTVTDGRNVVTWYVKICVMTFYQHNFYVSVDRAS